MPLESHFSNQEFCFQKQRMRGQMNMIMLIIMCHMDFYNQAVYYNCFCGWYKISEQVFKPVGYLLNISDCYYRLNFMCYGWFICMELRTHNWVSILLWKCYPARDSTWTTYQSTLKLQGEEALRKNIVIRKLEKAFELSLQS